MSKSSKEHRSSKFRLALIDNQSHKQLWTLHFTKTSLFVTVVTLVVTLCIIIYSLIAFTPIRTFIPGYPDARSKRAAIQNAIKIDSLETVIYKWGLYSENIKRVLEGADPIKIDSIVNAGMAAASRQDDMTTILKQDSLLREKVKEEEQFGITARTRRTLPIEGLHFFSPLKGVVSQGYDPVAHPYIDITAPAGSVVKSVLDGTVIFAGWDDKTGHTIQVQHEGDIISNYLRKAETR